MLARSRMPTPVDAVHGRLVHAQPRGGVFPSRDNVHAVPAVRAAAEDDSRWEPQGDSLLVGHLIDSVNDGLLAVEQLVLPETGFRLPVRTACSPLFRVFRTARHRLWKKPADVPGIAVGVTVA